MTRPCLLSALALLAGCQMCLDRTLDNPGRSQVVRVDNGDRLHFTLDGADGAAWSAAVDDPHLEVRLAPLSAGRTPVEVRVHRGFDGAGSVRFRLKRPGAERAEREFVLSLFRRTGDVAFWE